MAEEAGGDGQADKHVIACVAAFRNATRGESELELRLGNIDAGKFSPGVSREVFDQLECDLLGAVELVADEQWVETVDYHYTVSREDRARTRVEFDASCMELRREHTRKSVEGIVQLKRVEDVGTGPCEACRVAWALETPLKNPPSSCVPTHVRVKQKRCFRDVRDGATVWSYELAKTWSAGSRSAVEHLQHYTEPVYEVECELIDEGGLYLAQRTDAQVAASLVLKAQLLMGDAANARLVTTSVPTRKRGRA